MYGTVATFLRYGLGVQLSRLSLAWRRQLDNELRAHGLTEATWRPLFHLGRLGDGVRQKDLAKALGIEGPSLVRQLDSLQAAGLAERRESADDRRCKLLFMTPSGQALHARVAEIASIVSNELLAGIPDADIAHVREVLDRIETTIGQRRDKECDNG